MNSTTQRVLYWLTHINIGAAFGIVAFLVYSSIQTVFIEPNGHLVKLPQPLKVKRVANESYRSTRLNPWPLSRSLPNSHLAGMGYCIPLAHHEFQSINPLTPQTV